MMKCKKSMKLVLNLNRTILLCLLVLGLKTATAQTKVVLKLDDIGAKNGSCKALPVMQYLLQRGVKASYGVIANRLDETAKPLLADVLSAKDVNGQPMVEIWNHGLDHSRTGNVFEFKNSPYQIQQQHFKSAHALVKKYLDIEMTTFGAPFNAADTTCLKIIAEHGGYKKVFFSRVEVNFNIGFERLNNNMPMEKETGKPDFDYFLTNYNKYKNYLNSNIVLQGHPPYWTADGLAEFKKILDFLDEKHCVYVLPSSL